MARTGSRRQSRPRKRRSGSARRGPIDYASLNPPQREAVFHDTGPLLILAGAGSGKTRVIIFRIARLLDDGVPGERILGVTFTNKAAKEMRQRLRSLAGKRAEPVHLSTFHALGLAILKEESEAAGLGPRFCIYDTSDQLGLVRELMRKITVADRRLDAFKVLDVILRTKRRRLDEVPILDGDDYELAAYDLYPRYLRQMRAFNAVDFDDLILRAQDVLGQDGPRKRWSERFDYLLVDEYQDTSPDQFSLLHVLAGGHKNICVVGDDDQSIYAWRGAAVDNILNFSRKFKNTREVILDQNYRSTGHILAAANHVITNNTKRKEKQLWSAGGDGEPVQIVTCKDADSEAEYVVDQIHKLVYDGNRHDDIAVLYRANAQSRIFEETLQSHQIPFRVVGGQAFFDRKEVRDAMAYLAVAHNPYDEVSLRRIINTPPRGIGLTSVERLIKHSESTGKGLWTSLTHADNVPGISPQALRGARDLISTLRAHGGRVQNARAGQAAHAARELFEALHLRDAVIASDDAPGITARRLENLDEISNALARFETRLDGDKAPLAEFLAGAALNRKDEEDDSGKGEVTLMTLHSAKGLEFRFVFMVGVEEDLLPHRRTLELGGDLAEERRLCYVGITRARERLWITWSKSRVRHGRATPCGPSRFVLEIPEVACATRSEQDAEPSEEEADAAADAFFKSMRAKLAID